jgi:hypothetical protein
MKEAMLGTRRCKESWFELQSGSHVIRVPVSGLLFFPNPRNIGDRPLEPEANNISMSYTFWKNRNPIPTCCHDSWANFEYKLVIFKYLPSFEKGQAFARDFI